MSIPHTDTPYQLILSQGLPDAAAAARLRQDLPAAEWHWITRLRQPDDRLRSLTARALVRRLLGRRLGLSPAAIRLGTDPLGKPMLIDGPTARAPAWQFNMAHSRDLVLVGIGPGSLGVDVEHRPAAVDNGLWQQVTGHRMPTALAGRTDAAAQAFCAQWVRREAVLKACGLGLRIEPGTLHLADGDPMDWTCVTGLAAADALQVRLLWDSPAHCAALCLPRTAARPGSWSLHTVELAAWIAPSGS